MTQRIGHAPRTRSFNRPLDREVEGNDPFIGKERNRRAYQRTGGKQGSAGKAVILGFVDRGGVLRAGTTPPRDLVLLPDPGLVLVSGFYQHAEREGYYRPRPAPR